MSRVTSRVIRIFVAAALAIAAMTSCQAQAKRVVIGVLPVYDNSGESLTENLPVNLTYMIYRDLAKNDAYEPALLSPGALYDPESVDTITDYAARAKADVVLISSILPCIKVNNLKCRLQMEVQLVNVGSGKSGAKAKNDTVEVATVDLLRTVAATYVSSNYASFLKGPEDFEKQPLGKSAVKLADWTRGYIGSTLPGLNAAPTGTGAEGKPIPCDMDVHVRYVTKHSVSKAYTLIVNDKDETSAIKDGIAHFTMQSGPIVIRLQATDPPYRMPIEKMYQSSAILDCSASHDLTMDIGSAGDLLTHWQ
jgi:hypothetical protein